MKRSTSQSQSKPPLFIDTREKANAIKRVLDSHGIPYEITTLHAGDYWIPHESGKPIIVERSTYSDFTGKIASGRVWHQTDNMLAYTDPHLIYWVLENPYKLKRSKMDLRSFYGVVLGLVARGAHVLTTLNQTETGFILYLLYKRYALKSVGELRPYRKSNVDVVDDWTHALNVLVGFEGVGVRRAEKWLVESGSLVDAINMDYSELSRVLGKGLATNIYRLIHKKFISGDDIVSIQ